MPLAFTETLTPVPSPPRASSPTTRKVMRGNRSVSALEVALRSELHRRGMRFRKNAIAIPGLRCRVPPRLGSCITGIIDLNPTEPVKG